MKKKKHKISKVLPGSIGEELELEPGDVLAEINHQPVEDVFDYRYLMNDEYIELLIEKANGEIWELEVEKDYDEDLGIEFENGLMDDYRSCSNHCMFCFIDQMPPGMRETLYFKDDDSRLSFLQGNYVTLTNMSQEDIQRVIKYHLSPINVSFQAMNPKLRCKMLHNRFAVTGSVHTGAILVDGLGVGDVGNIVLRDRQHLAEDGIMIVVMTLERHSNVVLAGPDIVSRGFVYVRESEDLMEHAKEVVESALDSCLERNITDWGKIKNVVKDALSEFLWKRTKRSPMILPIIMEA